jgi:predicted TIM-barrel enzyme
MTTRFAKIFPGEKPVIAMVHFAAFPGSPLYDAGLDGLDQGIRKDAARGH